MKRLFPENPSWRYALFCLSCLGMTVCAADRQDVAEAVRRGIEKAYPSLEKFYQELHASPELSLQEEKTAAKISTELKAIGFRVEERIGGHGVVGVFTNGPGPVLLIRTDLDALPVTEQTGAPYASKVRTLDDKKETVGVMHACGHDVHMAVFVGVARLISSLRDQWRGTLMFIGQPAEERGKGARAMLAGGLFTRFPKPNYCVALHCSATMEAGTVGYVEGFVLANVDSVDITIRGFGGHGAWPHKTKDPVVLAAQTVLALQTIVSRETSPIDPAVVTVGSIHGGTKHNIIPDEVRLQVTLRSYSDEVRKHTLEAIHRITRGLAQAAGLPESHYPTVLVKDEFTPATYNDPQLTRQLVKAFQSWLGVDRVMAEKPVMGGEDFSEYGRTQDKIPISLFWLGTVSPHAWKEHRERGKTLPSLHSSDFLPFPEPTIKTGITAMSAAIFELLPRVPPK